MIEHHDILRFIYKFIIYNTFAKKAFALLVAGSMVLTPTVPKPAKNLRREFFIGFRIVSSGNTQN